MNDSSALPPRFPPSGSRCPPARHSTRRWRTWRSSDRCGRWSGESHPDLREGLVVEVRGLLRRRRVVAAHAEVDDDHDDGQVEDDDVGDQVQSGASSHRISPNPLPRVVGKRHAHADGASKWLAIRLVLGLIERSLRRGATRRSRRRGSRRWTAGESAARRRRRAWG